MPRIIWTNHALKRVNDRKITQNQIIQTVSSPDSQLNSEDGSVEYVKEFGIQKIHAIIKENTKGELILLSCWVNPPNSGTSDFKNEKLQKEIKHSGPLKKMWLTFLNQLGF
jgi:hypothetical protein